MRKKSPAHPIWIPILITVIATTGIFVLAEYVFHIPSRYLMEEKTPVRDDNNSWTPRTPIALQSPAPLGSSGSTGTTDRPTACTMEYAPVCGADGRDYSNACMARAGGTVVVSEGNCKNEVAPVTSGTAGETPSVTGEVKDLSLFDTGSYHIYENKSFGYALALPRFAYYQGIGARDGATHALVIGLTSTGAEDTNSADVVVYFFKTIPATPPAGGQEIQTQNGTIYVVSHTSSPKIDKILEAIRSSAQ